MAERQLSKAESIEEQKKWSMRFFDYAEAPIKEWLAEYLEEDVECLFADYKEHSDVLSVESDGDQYTFYITPHKNPDEKTFDIDEKRFKGDVALRKATSIIFDAVKTVYMPVMTTILRFSNKVNSLAPAFDEKNMRFYLTMVNKPLMKRKEALKPMGEIEHQLQRLKGCTEEKANELRSQLHEVKRQRLQMYAAVTDDDVKIADGECKRLNELLVNGPYLYICAECNIEPDEEHIVRRLPHIGVRYEDPDSNTLVEQLKNL